MTQRSASLNDEITLQDPLEVQQYFGLSSPTLVEKDYYLVKARPALAAIDTTSHFSPCSAVAPRSAMLRAATYPHCGFAAQETMPVTAFQAFLDARAAEFERRMGFPHLEPNGRYSANGSGGAGRYPTDV
jgi:hypothetical protein